MPSGRKEQQVFVDKLVKNKDIHFSRQQIEKLIYKFDEVLGRKALKEKSHLKIERNVFKDILHNYFGITEDLLTDRIFRAFDRDSDNQISREEWVIGLSSMLSCTQNSDAQSDAQRKFVFCVYDLNGDGYISRDEMFQLLKNCVSKQQTEEDKEESVKELVEMVVKRAVTHDSSGGSSSSSRGVSYSDYTEMVKKEPLLLEFLGQCLPNPQRASLFLQLIDEIKIRH